MKLFGHVYYFYWPTMFRDRLMGHWLQFYRDNLPNLERQYSFGLEEWLIIACMVIMVGRAVITNFGPPELINDYQFRLMLGSFYHLIHSTPFRVETMTALWAFTQLTVMATMHRFKLRRFQWMALVETLEAGPESGFLIGLTRSQSYIFQKHTRPLMRVINSITHQSSMVMSTVFIILFFRYYPWYEFVLYCIPWTIFNYWATQNVAGVIYIMGTYIMLLKSVVKIKLDSYTRRIERTFSQQQQQPQTMMFRVQLSDRLLGPLTNQFREIDVYNQFWRDLMTAQMFWRILIINFAAYIVLFVEFSVVTICYLSVWFNEMSTLIFMIRNISALVPQMTLVRKKLQNGLCRNRGRIPVTCKIKILREMTSLFLLLIQMVSH